MNGYIIKVFNLLPQNVLHFHGQPVSFRDGKRPIDFDMEIDQIKLDSFLMRVRWGLATFSTWSTASNTAW